MDLIYIILSVYLRLFQAALPMSRAKSQDARATEKQQWAVWIPLVGWVSVLVRYAPQALWLTWRVTSVQRLDGRRGHRWRDWSSRFHKRPPGPPGASASRKRQRWD